MILKVLHYSLASPSPSTVITRFLHVCGRSPSRWPFARPVSLGSTPSRTWRSTGAALRGSRL